MVDVVLDEVVVPGPVAVGLVIAGLGVGEEEDPGE
jgi:hypothetical protein